MNRRIAFATAALVLTLAFAPTERLSISSTQAAPIPVYPCLLEHTCVYLPAPVASVVRPSFGCYNYSCDGQSPTSMGCYTDPNKTQVDDVLIKDGMGNTQGDEALYYSPGCGTSFGVVTNHIYTARMINLITRNSDGKHFQYIGNFNPPAAPLTVGQLSPLMGDATTTTVFACGTVSNSNNTMSWKGCTRTFARR